MLQERYPFQYLVGAAHWRDLVLAVGPGVLIPRPETEQMVDLAAAALSQRPHLSGLPWADLGCGSGAPCCCSCAGAAILFFFFLSCESQHDLVICT